MDALISSFQAGAVGESDRTAVKFLRATNWKVDKALQLFSHHKQNSISSFLKSAPIDESSSSSDNGTPIKFLRAANWDVKKALTMYKSREEKDYEEEEESAAVRESALKPMREPEAEHSTTLFSHAPLLLLRRNFNLASSVENSPLLDLIMHRGTFDQAKDVAFQQNKWLIVNVLSKTGWSSSLLNRETWGNEASAETIRNSFVFWQVYDHTEDGKRICNDYEVGTFPIVMVVDPIQGEKIRSWTGMVIHPEPLLEHLQEFIDQSPQAYQARRQSVSDDEKLTRENDFEEEEDEDESSVRRPVTIDGKFEGQEEASPTDDDRLKSFFIFCLRAHV